MLKLSEDFYQNLLQKMNKKHWLFDSWWAGMWVGLGAWMFTITPNKILGAFLFCFSLMLIIIHQAELFTGDILWGLVNPSLKNWGKLCFVYLGNFLGAYTLSRLGKGPAPDKFMLLLDIKMQIPWIKLVIKGILCNWLVCSAIYHAAHRENYLEKFLAVTIHIVPFAYLGFEHSVANMFIWSASNSPLLPFLCKNLIFVTLGNILGGLGVVFSIKYVNKG